MGARAGWISVIAVFLAIPLVGAGGGGGSFLVKDLKSPGNAADYLVISPGEYVETLEPLLKWRSEHGLKPAVVTLDSIESAFEESGSTEDRVRAFIRHVAASWKPPKIRFVLIAADVGAEGSDAPGIPTFIVDAPSVGTCASDNPYGCVDESPIPELAVGRFPARSKEELAGMVDRTVRYERDRAPGAWRKKFAFLAGEGRFGPMIDGMLESIFTKIVSGQIPYDFDVDLTYHNPRSPYFYPSEEFSDRVVERMNEGSLVFTYVGHGSKGSFDGGILRTEDVSDVACESGAPVVVVIACSTGYYDDPVGDCIGEALMKRPDGPVAFLGSSRVSQPYANGVFGLGLVTEIFAEGERRPLGELMVAAKSRLNAEPENPLRSEIDSLGMMFLPPKEMEEQRIEHISLYNLLGDPALELAYPDAKCTLKAASTTGPGRSLKVFGEVDGIKSGDALVTIEVERRRFVDSPEPEDPFDTPEAREAKIKKNYEQANRKIIVEEKVKFRRGKFKATLTLPEDVEPGQCYLKAYVVGKDKIATGARPITIETRSRKK